MGDLVLNKSHETSLWTYNIDKIKVCSLEQILWKKAPTHPSPPPILSSTWRPFMVRFYYCDRFTQ